MLIAAFPQVFTAHDSPWTWEPAFTLPLFGFGLFIAIGLVRLRMRGGYSKQWLRQSTLLSFGWFSLLIALNSPIHSLGESLFWVHMIQHEVLLLISAPLFVVGNLYQAALAAFPQKFSKELGGVLRETGLHSAFLFFSRPLPAWCLGAAGLWIWHVPLLFDATLRSDAIHAAQHLTFLSTSFFFWVALLAAATRRAAHGISILYLFATAIQTTFLGVLMTYSARPWYSPYVFTAPQFGYSPLEDQQIGGLIMWIPAGAVFTAIALALVPAWLRSSDVRHALWAEQTLNMKDGGASQ
jgi:cytochrome c oxidase assembly factor CtaG